VAWTGRSAAGRGHRGGGGDRILVHAGDYLDGLLVDDVASDTGGRTVRIVGGPFVSCGDVGAALRGASGVDIKAAYFEACPLVLGGSPNYAITLDAASSNNVVAGSILAGAVTDLGTHNCFRTNVDADGAPLPDACP
jgi:hypothetical protein